MASILTVSLQLFISLLRVFVLCGLVALLSACEGGGESVVNQSLALPEREELAYITDQVYVAGNILSLWDNDGGCQLQASKDGQKNTKVRTMWVKPMAPCYFIKSPGSDKAQVFQQDKATRIVGILGTAIQQDSSKRCGKEVQGLMINGHGNVRLSDRILSGSVYCAESGLDNFQYSLFHGS